MWWGGGAHRHVIYVPSVKNQYKRVLYLDIWLFNNSHLCQFIEIVHNIINWYMKDNYLSVLYKHIIQVENKNVG